MCVHLFKCVFIWVQAQLCCDMGVAGRGQPWCHPCWRQDLFAAACDIAADPETSRASAVSTSFLTVGTLRFQRCTQSPVFTSVLRIQTQVSTCATSVLPTGPCPQCGLEFFGLAASIPNCWGYTTTPVHVVLGLEPKTFCLYRKHSPYWCLPRTHC